MAEMNWLRTGRSFKETTKEKSRPVIACERYSPIDLVVATDYSSENLWNIDREGNCLPENSEEYLKFRSSNSDSIIPTASVVDHNAYWALPSVSNLEDNQYHNTPNRISYVCRISSNEMSSSLNNMMRLLTCHFFDSVIYANRCDDDIGCWRRSLRSSYFSCFWSKSKNLRHLFDIQAEILSQVLSSIEIRTVTNSCDVVWGTISQFFDTFVNFFIRNIEEVFFIEWLRTSIRYSSSDSCHILDCLPYFLQHLFDLGVQYFGIRRASLCRSFLLERYWFIWLRIYPSVVQSRGIIADNNIHDKCCLLFTSPLSQICLVDHGDSMLIWCENFSIFYRYLIGYCDKAMLSGCIELQWSIFVFFLLETIQFLFCSGESVPLDQCWDDMPSLEMYWETKNKLDPPYSFSVEDLLFECQYPSRSISVNRHLQAEPTISNNNSIYSNVHGYRISLGSDESSEIYKHLLSSRRSIRSHALRSDIWSTVRDNTKLPKDELQQGNYQCLSLESSWMYAEDVILEELFCNTQYKPIRLHDTVIACDESILRNPRRVVLWKDVCAFINPKLLTLWREMIACRLLRPRLMKMIWKIIAASRCFSTSYCESSFENIQSSLLLSWVESLLLISYDRHNNQWTTYRRMQNLCKRCSASISFSTLPDGLIGLICSCKSDSTTSSTIKEFDPFRDQCFLINEYYRTFRSSMKTFPIKLLLFNASKVTSMPWNSILMSPSLDLSTSHYWCSKFGCASKMDEIYSILEAVMAKAAENISTEHNDRDGGIEFLLDLSNIMIQCLFAKTVCEFQLSTSVDVLEASIEKIKVIMERFDRILSLNQSSVDVRLWIFYVSFVSSVNSIAVCYDHSSSLEGFVQKNKKHLEKIVNKVDCHLNLYVNAMNNDRCEVPRFSNHWFFYMSSKRGIMGWLGSVIRLKLDFPFFLQPHMKESLHKSNISHVVQPNQREILWCLGYIQGFILKREFIHNYRYAVNEATWATIDILRDIVVAQTSHIASIINELNQRNGNGKKLLSMHCQCLVETMSLSCIFMWLLAHVMDNTNETNELMNSSRSLLKLVLINMRNCCFSLLNPTTSNDSHSQFGKECPICNININDYLSDKITSKSFTSGNESHDKTIPNYFLHNLWNFEDNDNSGEYCFGNVFDDAKDTSNSSSVLLLKRLILRIHSISIESEMLWVSFEMNKQNDWSPIRIERFVPSLQACLWALFDFPVCENFFLSLWMIEFYFPEGPKRLLSYLRSRKYVQKIEILDNGYNAFQMDAIFHIFAHMSSLIRRQISVSASISGALNDCCMEDWIHDFSRYGTFMTNEGPIFQANNAYSGVDEIYSFVYCRLFSPLNREPRLFRLFLRMKVMEIINVFDRLNELRIEPSTADISHITSLFQDWSSRLHSGLILFPTSKMIAQEAYWMRSLTIAEGSDPNESMVSDTSSAKSKWSLLDWKSIVASIDKNRVYFKTLEHHG